MEKSDFTERLVGAFILVLLVVLCIYIAITNQYQRGIAIFLVSILFIAITLLFLSAGSYFGRGKPKVSLPHGKKFKTIKVEENNDYFFLWLKEKNEEPEYFKVPRNILYEGKTNTLAVKFPDEFKIAKSKRIKKGEEQEKRPELQTVYYILAIEEGR